VFKL